MLAMLALDVGRMVSTERLAEGLWGETRPASAAKMVQSYVSRLRRVLDGSGASIVTRDRGYVLQLLPDDVDAARFERLVDTDPRGALAAWRGAALADLADEPFAAAEIRRLDALRLRAVELAIDADLEAGRHAEVLSELDALVAEQPLREHPQAQRMRALYRCGRQADALDAYREARAALVEQVGVEPGAELRSLQGAILAHDPALDLSTTPDLPPAIAPRAPPRGRARRLLPLAGAVVLLAAGATMFVVTRTARPHGLPRIDENHIGLIDPDGGRITAQYPVGKGPGAATAGAGSVWVANRLDGTISRIDRGHHITTIPVGGAPAAVAFGSGSLWVADGESRTVAQVDPEANKIVQTVEAADAPRSLAVASEILWVASGVDGRVQRIDLDHPGARQSIAIGANPTALAAGAGALWVASEEARTVTRIDPRSGTVVRTIAVGNPPTALAVGAGAVWVVSRRAGTLSRLDPERDAVAWTVPVGSDPTTVDVGAGGVWVAGGEDGTIIRVAPERPADVQRVEVGGSPAAIAVADGRVWAAALAPAAAHRGGTLRVLLPVEEGAVPFDPVQRNAYFWRTALLSSLVYDGLVAYRRVGGVAGATLVGGLATSVPSPSDDGRTYAFTLRDGVRFSDGNLVVPEDFRASIERLFQVTGDRYSAIFGGIVGAARCARRPVRCDLARGIETDARLRTITVHLTDPDSEFLHKLTLNLAFVVPAGSTLRPSADREPPGTGPYRVAAWDGHRGGRLVRNPHFRSTTDRQAGFADRVEVGLRDAKRVETSIAAVRRGAADLTLLAGPFVSLVRRDRLAALVARAPGRVHSDPVPTTKWMFLNMRRRPFDDLRVRQAINFATDRARLVALEGGPEVATATCQIVPPAFPGHEPYCPFTAEPSPGRGWTAPDVERARHLVNASGRAGTRVVVRVPSEARAIGLYFVGLLRTLGFRARLVAVANSDAYFSQILDPRSRVQMGFVGWGADYLSPSTFVEAFKCSQHSRTNASRLCDPALDRQIARARRTPSADAAPTWASADRRVSDLAAAVPMTNRRMVTLVSKRAGNVTQHPAWYTLLDQLWVR